MEDLRSDVEVASALHPQSRRELTGLLVNPNLAMSWLPADFLKACGIEPTKRVQFSSSAGFLLDRFTGVAFIHIGDRLTVDEVVFAQPGDPTMIGARSLAGLRLRVDPVLKQLVDAGPAPAAVAA